MKPRLLDVNVVVALFDPNHVNHEAAHEWFSRLKGQSWATCPLVVNGAFRILCRLAALSGPMTMEEIGRQMEELPALPGRIDLTSQPQITDRERFDLRGLRGPNQITDALLLAIAIENGGRLVSFDRSIPWKAVRGAKASDLELL